VGKGGLQFAVDADAAGAVTAAVRAETDLPLMVKLSPNVADVRAIARAVERGGADAISAINTLSGIAIDVPGRRPLLGNVYGGVSGPAIKPIALRVVYEVAQAVELPIVGIGGIGTLEDALEFFLVGASAVQVGTAIFADPTVPARIIEGLPGYCAEHGFASVRELVGLALPHGPRSRAVPPSVKGVEYRP
jgi:dihydroorotate dehydrogenase (NAD+) catalytic subunit